MKNNILKLKKYLFLISVIFLVSSLVHLIYIFLYNDSQFIAIKWGSISEWLIWEFPSLNPLKPLSGNNKYLVNILYRSLLKYDVNENKIVSDITSCDISNLLYIECYLEDNIKWNNWESITSEDIISTYKILQNTDINPIIASLLADTEITSKDNIITFKNSKSDVNFLNIFFQPIVPKKIIDELWEENLNWNFSTLNWIYSWKYSIATVSNDLALWIVKFILEKNNNYYNNPVLIDKFIIKLFSDTSSFLKNKNSINIFNDKDNIIWDSIPRFDTKKYTLPQYVWLFLNMGSIDNVDLRTFILDQINQQNLVKILWENNYEIVNNPYFTENKLINNANNKNFEYIISKLWYKKKSELIKIAMQDSQKYSNTNTGAIKETEAIKTEVNTEVKELSIDNFQKDSEYIVSPGYIDKYNFVTKDDILLKWVAPKNTSEVYVNDYKLQNFAKNDEYFYYRLKESINNIIPWENNYKIYFTINWEKKLYEELTFIYNSNPDKLNEGKNNLIKKLEQANKKPEIIDTKLIEENGKKLETVNLLLDKLNLLDDKSFYNKDLEKFSLNLVYIDWDKEINQTSLYIEKTLKEIWIEVNSKPIMLSQLQDYIWSDKKYDMIISWINTWYFPFNLFAYLHSSQVKKWYNFSNIRKTSLDILLEELQWNILSDEKIKENEEKVLDILQKEQIFKTLYTPKINLLIDKNINNINFPNHIPENSLRIDILDKAYINEKRIINFENKTIINFFKFIIKKINE